MKIRLLQEYVDALKEAMDCRCSPENLAAALTSSIDDFGIFTDTESAARVFGIEVKRIEAWRAVKGCGPKFAPPAPRAIRGYLSVIVDIAEDSIRRLKGRQRIESTIKKPEFAAG